jgi:hypothetical protein
MFLIIEISLLFALDIMCLTYLIELTHESFV